MRLTEHELTVALTGVAKSGLAGGRRGRRRGQSADEAWEAMDRYRRFQLLSGLGSQVLPVLAALPDVDVAPGGRPTCTDREVSAVVEGLLDAEAGGSTKGGRVRRAVTVRARTALVQLALAHVPPRLDPDDARRADPVG